MSTSTTEKLSLKELHDRLDTAIRNYQGPLTGCVWSSEPLAKLSRQGNLWAGISNFRIGLSLPTLKEVIPTVCSLPFPVS